MPVTAARQDATEEPGGRPARRPSYWTSPSELRKQARLFTAISEREANPQTKRAFASAAYVLAQLGECIERLNKAE